MAAQGKALTVPSNMAIYKSDISRLIENLKQQNPYLEEEQRRGRSIWWDKDPVDLDELRQARESRVPQQPRLFRGTR